MPRPCTGKQHRAATEPQRDALGSRRHEGGPCGTLPLADRIDLTGIHELPLVPGHRPQQLHGHLRHRGRHDTLQRRKTPHGGQAAGGAEPHRRTLGRGDRQRHPHRHRRSLHAVPLCHGVGHGEPQYGRSIEGPARPRRADVACRVDQQGRFRPVREPVCKRPLPGRRCPHVARQLQAPAQAAARARHHGPDRAGGPYGRGAGVPRTASGEDRDLRDGSRGHAGDRTRRTFGRGGRAGDPRGEVGIPAVALAHGRDRNRPHRAAATKAARKSGTASTRTWG